MNQGEPQVAYKERSQVLLITERFTKTIKWSWKIFDISVTILHNKIQRKLVEFINSIKGGNVKEFIPSIERIKESMKNGVLTDSRPWW